MSRRRRRTYKFTEKTHSKKAMISAVMSTISLLVYFIFVFLSYKAGGKLSMYYGGFGFLAMLISVAGLVISIITLKEEDTFTLFPQVALITSILSSLCWVGTYILGMVRG